MTTKWLIIGCSTAAAIFIIVVAVGMWFAAKSYTSFVRNMPGRPEVAAVLKTPKVLVGSDFLKGNALIKDDRLGSITDIAMGELDGRGKTLIGVASDEGALFLNEKMEPVSFVPYGAAFQHVDIIDAENDGVCEFMARGSWMSNPGLFDHQGKMLWSYGGKMPGVDDMAAGDIDGDGFLEFVVGFNGGGGVHLLDRHWKKKWSKSDGNVWHVEITDTNGDGKPEIVHSNAAGVIVVRDKDGNIISQHRPETYFSHFTLVNWPTRKDRMYPLLTGKGTAWIVNYDGKTLASFDAPALQDLGDTWGTLVKLKSGEKDYLAVLAAYRNFERSVLCVFDPTGKLAYEEVILETRQAIAALPVNGADTQTLLVGGERRIWQYDLAKPSATTAKAPKKR